MCVCVCVCVNIGGVLGHLLDLDINFKLICVSTMYGEPF